MKTPNQIHVKREDVKVTAADLLNVPEGQITDQGLRMNVDVGIQYLESWLRGNGCVPIYNLMEDAATAEISRTQVWQWMHHGAQLSNGQKIVGSHDPRHHQDPAGPDSLQRGRCALRQEQVPAGGPTVRAHDGQRRVQGLPHARSVPVSVGEPSNGTRGTARNPGPARPDFLAAKSSEPTSVTA